MKPLLAALLLSCVAAQPLQAGELSDLIMAPGLFSETRAGDGAGGELLRYAHDRHLPSREAGGDLPGQGHGLAMPRPVSAGVALLSRQDGPDRLVLSLGENGGPPAPMGEFPPDGANPILLVFLENVVRNMAVQTGGSPHYIRNRIREALGEADLGQAAGPGRLQVELQPFHGDPNRSRMGEFAQLRLSLTFDPRQPQRLVELKADTASGQDGYYETLSLIEEE